ncbi:MAG: thermonuclease family protein [Lamprobacter sp.]|uniref:thermonuclease family protein n=1 Tax=Lamprobacter sp. TaxID=3100796 RepID=UPI002B25C1C6|nr:thermonuclease family protein [Lamprobacter sp.]MEA3642432.1 thermonuclease family protein [Lamprobacter sp.]
MAAAHRRQRRLSSRQHLRWQHPGSTLSATCSGLKLKVRLYCIDTPEMQQRPWGTESGDYLRRITPRVVSLRIHDTDRYGRKVAEVIDPTSGTVLNRAMVEAGQAAVYQRYCPDPSDRQAEAGAKAARIGIWSQPGDHQRPRDWRNR